MRVYYRITKLISRHVICKMKVNRKYGEKLSHIYRMFNILNIDTNAIDKRNIIRWMDCIISLSQ